MSDNKKKKKLKKNILYIVHSYKSFQKDPIEAISNKFHKVYVFVRYKPIAELSRIVPINSLKNHTKSNAINLSGLPKNVYVYAIPLFYLPTKTGYKNLGLKHYTAVLRRIEKLGIDFDIIHCHFTWTSGYVGMRLKRVFRKPLVITGHGYDVYDLPFRDNNWQCRIKDILNSADIVTTVSKCNYDKIRSLEISTPVEVIPNGFNSDIFQPLNKEKCRRDLNLPFDKKIILTVGNLVPIKGQQLLIESMIRVINKQPDAVCYMVGEGYLKNKLQKQINRMNLSSKVFLVGRKPHKDIPIWMNAADVFVLPSLAEGNPTVMFECLGCGVPFIGTSVGGIPEITKSGITGLLLKNRDSEELADTILRSLDRDWDVSKIHNYGKKFDWENVSNRFLDIYDSLI